MRLNLSKDEAYNLLKFLKESKHRYANLSALAEERTKKNDKYVFNAEKLKNQHKSTSDLAQNLINKIVEQL